MNFHADTTSGEEGVALFHEIRARFPDLPVILLTAWTHLEAAVDLVKAGAADYLAKPWDDQKLMATVNNLLELGQAQRELSRQHAGERQRRTALLRENDLRGLVFDDPASEATVALACQVARSDIPVLVTGPNGTGKEEYAEIVHANSPVRTGPVVALNCGPRPADLIDADLSGAEPGPSPDPPKNPPSNEATVALACQFSRSDIPVRVTGPNGTGKEKYAEIVHANSHVRNGPFVALNCGALPADLIEAELFGAEPGAYTGANKAREGKFEAADGGTLFLDEIGTLPLAGQVKLLRVLETGRFERLGGNRERSVTVRIVSATNADLAVLIADGRFREDLFYRLNGIELRLPPLSARPRDILPLARHFLAGGKRLAEDAERALLRHAWPGNVRELRDRKSVV